MAFKAFVVGAYPDLNGGKKIILFDHLSYRAASEVEASKAEEVMNEDTLPWVSPHS